MNPAYNENCRGDGLFSAASKLCFVQVLEIWILRHSKKVSVMSRFRLRQFSLCKYYLTVLKQPCKAVFLSLCETTAR